MPAEPLMLVRAVAGSAGTGVAAALSKLVAVPCWLLIVVLVVVVMPAVVLLGTLLLLADGPVARFERILVALRGAPPASLPPAGAPDG